MKWRLGVWTKAHCLSHPHCGESWVIHLGEEDAIVFDGANTVVGFGSILCGGAIDFRGPLATVGLLLATVTASYHNSRFREQIQDVQFHQGRSL